MYLGIINLKKAKPCIFFFLALCSTAVRLHLFLFVFLRDCGLLLSMRKNVLTWLVVSGSEE